MSDRARETWGYVAGLLLAVLLTGAAFAAVRWPETFGARTFAFVCALGLIQAVLQFRFFLHVRLRGSARDDLLLLLFSSLIILLMVAGTLVLMANLRNRMM
ncbi:cytochrome C oxidase subunit IV family protein [Sphingomonas sp. PsM26]|jgi:cytochrome o ubiquinol oxidase operon protein cyoD|nr:cytochrome C oxidase subunit IV family protein [Sphingomonas sp. PsM26]